MQYLYQTPSASGAYPPLQSSPAPGLLAFPEEFLPEFYPPDKQAAGFVEIEHDGGIVTACRWNEEAYQAYLAALPEPEEPPPAVPSLEDRVAIVEEETAAIAAAIERGLSL